MFEKKFVYAFFIYLVLEGALRKWFFASFSNELFLVKDVLLMVAVFGWMGKTIIIRGSVASVVTPLEALLLWGWALFFSGFCLISGFSFTALVGLRYYLVMLPLAVILPHVVDDLADLNRLAERYCRLAFPVCLLGLAQFFSPPEAFINRYAWNEDPSMGVAALGLNKARITGTFSYIAPYTVYLLFVFLAGLVLFKLSGRGRSRILLGAGTALMFVNIVMTGSRAPFLIASVLAVPFLLSALKEASITRGQIFSLSASFLVIGLLLFQFGNVFSLLSLRNSEARDTDKRVTGSLYTPLHTLKEAELAGAGIGTTFMGVREVSGDKEEAGFDEVNTDRIGVETGIFGYIFVLLFKLVFLGKAWTLYRGAFDRAVKTWALAVFCYQLTFLWSVPVYNSVAAAFYFACIGLYVFLRNEQARIGSGAQAALTAV